MMNRVKRIRIVVVGIIGMLALFVGAPLLATGF